jgi:hypothetical protein
MSAGFYKILFASLMLIVGFFLAFYWYRHLMRKFAGKRALQKFVTLRPMTRGDFQGEVFVSFEIPSETQIRITLLNAEEKEIHLYHESVHPKGILNIRCLSTDFPDGEYYFLCSTPNQQLQRKFRIRNHS